MIGAFYMIYAKVFKNDTLSFNVFKTEVLQSNLLQIKMLSLVLGLSFLNWILEIKKWQLLVNSFKTITFQEATKQSLSSLTTSLITPNRIGEYGAKAFYFNKTESKRILFLNFIGNSAQLLVTCIFGSVGLLFLWREFKFTIEGFNNSYLILILGIIFGLFVLGFSLLKRFKSHQSFHLKSLIMLKTIAIAVLRYVVFSFQFYVLIRIFHIDLSLTTIYACITSMYLLASIIPSISLFDVVIKSSISVLVFGFVGVKSLPILVIVLIMWLCNFALPSLIGSYFVWTFQPKTALK